jgi:hypothetical protein
LLQLPENAGTLNNQQPPENHRNWLSWGLYPAESSDFVAINPLSSPSAPGMDAWHSAFYLPACRATVPVTVMQLFAKLLISRQPVSHL